MWSLPRLHGDIAGWSRSARYHGRVHNPVVRGADTGHRVVTASIEALKAMIVHIRARASHHNPCQGDGVQRITGHSPHILGTPRKRRPATFLPADRS
jgi:hypothetical protein